MRKSNVFNVTVVSSRNELIEALKRKDVVIKLDLCIEGEDIDDFPKEFSKGKESKAFRNAGVIAFLTLPGIGMLLGAGAIAAGGIGMLLNDTNNYELAAFEDDLGEKHVILINTKKYDGKIDLIMGYEQYKFIGTKMYQSSCKCPKCNQKVKRAKKILSDMKPIVCSGCNNKLVICRNH